MAVYGMLLVSSANMWFTEDTYPCKVMTQREHHISSNCDMSRPTFVCEFLCGHLSTTSMIMVSITHQTFSARLSPLLGIRNFHTAADQLHVLELADACQYLPPSGL